VGCTISEAAKRSGLTAYTLRYYDKEGLLPFVDRTSAGNRDFKESDFEWLNLITCLKRTGIPVKNIREFINWCREGDATLQQRLTMFLRHQKEVQEQMAELEHCMEKINYKIWYYTKAVEAGTEAIHNKDTCETVACSSAKFISEHVS